jgi:hypothetical protein
MSGPQVESAHESVGAGAGAQVPQDAWSDPPQWTLAHCPSMAHGAPSGRDPAGVQSAGRTPSKKSLQETVARAVVQAATVATVAPVPGAASAAVHPCATRVAQVSRSP